MFKRSIVVVVFSLLMAGAVLAQDVVVACQDVMGDYFSLLLENCQEVGRNEACYGTEMVRADFFEDADMDEDFFTDEGEVASLDDMRSITTSGYDPIEETWGLAMVEAQANVPETIPGQAVQFILMGNVQISNAISPQQVRRSVTAVPVTIGIATQALYNPRASSGVVIDGIESGDLFIGDAVDLTNEWVRIANRRAAGWVRIDRLDAESQEDVAELPQIDAAQQSAFQTFYIETNIRGEQCRQSPSEFVIQTPEDVEVEMTVNDVEMRIGSTVSVRTVANNDGDIVMDVVALSGQAILFPDTLDAVVVPAGEVLQGCLIYAERDLLDDSQLNNYNRSTCQTRPLAASEVPLLEVIQRLPDELILDERVREIVIEDICAVPAAWQGVHIITVDDTLAGLAQIYGMSPDELLAGNCLDRLIVGQQLIVPFVLEDNYSTPRPTSTPTPLITLTPTPTATFTPSVTPIISLTPSRTPTPTSTWTPTPVPCTPSNEWSGIYSVTGGDTLFGIASLYGVSLDNLLRVNCFSMDTILSVGQQVRVPFIPTNTPTFIPTWTPTPTFFVGPQLLNGGTGLSNFATMNNGEMQVEGYCFNYYSSYNNGTFVDGVFSDGTNWFCTNGGNSYQLFAYDYNIICQLTYNNFNAYAQQDFAGANGWRCYG